MYPVYNEILKDRSLMLKEARSFFADKNILEVDTPILSKKPSIDTHIDLMTPHVINNEIGYLHTSPEYLMKRLLSEGVPDIYFLGHVFRKDENVKESLSKEERCHPSYDNEAP